jgi:hemerythrin superfamily protein
MAKKPLETKELQQITWNGRWAHWSRYSCPTVGRTAAKNGAKTGLSSRPGNKTQYYRGKVVVSILRFIRISVHLNAHCRVEAQLFLADKGGRMDALELLKKDHRKAKELFEQAEETEQENDKKKIFKQIKKELETHARIEEGILYPSIENHEPLKEMVLNSYKEHREIKTLLREIDDLDSGSKLFEPKLKVLKEHVKRRNEEEERRIFPKVRELLGDETLEKISRQFEVAKGTREQIA